MVIWAFVTYYKARYDRSPESMALITEYSSFDSEEAMSISEIASLPTFTYTGTQSGERDICTICLEEFVENEVLTQLPGCSHNFHKS
jgi:hypothetical protein